MTKHELIARQQFGLAAFRRMLLASDGTLSFSVAVCNSPSLRDYLIAKFREETPHIALIDVNEDVTDILDSVSQLVSQENPRGVFIVGMEKLLPPDRSEHRILQTLNFRRESWQTCFSCPVVFWLAEYAATLLSIHARDLWSWLSHSFDFLSEQATASAGMMDAYSGDNILSAGNLSFDEKHFRIAELEHRIADAGDPPKAQLAIHVVIWLNELGYIYYSISEFGKAEQMLLKSLEINKNLGRWDGMSAAYGNLGLIYQARGDLSGAEQMHLKSLEIFKQHGRQDGMACQYGSLGSIYKYRGGYSKSVEGIFDLRGDQNDRSR